MNILYVFTYGYSLKTWYESGQLTRELKHFESLYDQNKNINFYLLTFASENDTSLVDYEYINVIPIYKYIKKSKFKIINLIKSFTFFITMAKILEKDIDIIIQNQLLGSWISILIKYKFGIPLIIRTGYDMYQFSIYEKKSKTKKTLYKYLTNFSLKFSDLYTVTSEKDKKFLIQNFNIKYLTKIKIRSNWVSSPVQNQFIEKKNKSFISVGRLEDQKNYRFLINALSETDYSLDIYGDGSLKKELVKLAKEKQVNINFLGITEGKKLIKNLNKYKYYISSSIYEGNPKSLLEAMSAGCLVIASNIEGHVEFLNNENSVLFDLENPIELKDIINNLENIEENKIKNLIFNSQKTVEKFYNLDTLVKKELEDINKILE